MRNLAPLIALLVGAGPAFAAPKKVAFRAVGYFAGNRSDGKGEFSDIVLKPGSTAASRLRLRGKLVKPSLARTFLELEFEAESDCGLSCDGTLRKIIDVVNPADVRRHPLRGAPRPLVDSGN